MRKYVAALICFLLIFSIFGVGMAEAIPAARAFGAPMDGSIRVLLQSLGARSALGLTIDGSYSVDGDRGFQLEPGTDIKLGLDNGSITLQAGGASIDMGGGFTLIRHLDSSGKAGGVYIHESEKDTLYCGDISFGVYPSGGIRVIVTLHIEDYLYGVLPYEMSDTFPLEALKAQAVAARSYAMQRKVRNASQDYDVVDTANDQVYKGLDARFTRPISAVDETKGIVGMVNGDYAELFYSASNGGQTALATDVWGRGDFGYLDIRDDPYDLENPESVTRRAIVPKDATRVTEPLYGLLVEALAQKMHASGEIAAGEAVGLGRVIAVEAVNPVYGGDSRQYGTIRFTVTPSVQRLTPAGELGEVQMLETQYVIDLSFYNQVRSALNIGVNSSSYDLVEVTETADGFTLTVRRYGHGVGLSQRGAQWMAGKYGKTHLEILSFYYPGLDLVQVTWAEKPLTLAAALPESLGYAAARPTPAPTPAPLPALQPGEYYAVVSVEGVDSTLNVREGPSLEHQTIGTLRSGTRLIVMEEIEDGWAKMKTVEYPEGYVSMSFIVKEGKEADAPAESAAPAATPMPTQPPFVMPSPTQAPLDASGEDPAAGGEAGDLGFYVF